MSKIGVPITTGGERVAVDGNDAIHVSLTRDGLSAGSFDFPADNLTDDSRCYPTAPRNHLYDPILDKWNRQRANHQLTLLASAARTATTQSADQVNYNHKGLILIIDVTARAAATTLTPNLEAIDPIGGDYKTIWTAAAAINTANGSYAYLFYPSPLGDAAELYVEGVDIVIPREFRLNVTHSDGDSITYSVAAFMAL